MWNQSAKPVSLSALAAHSASSAGLRMPASSMRPSRSQGTVQTPSVCPTSG
ncbi:hypothetical protein [Thiobacillus sp.]|uniref:hypothetical protein n=1 Tax=Thiobacillus sp. TaxID=924 RepID=UPI0025FFA105|nr:hypothetical protein [Thiobacillus sp.]